MGSRMEYLVDGTFYTHQQLAALVSAARLWRTRYNSPPETYLAKARDPLTDEGFRYYKLDATLAKAVDGLDMRPTATQTVQPVNLTEVEKAAQAWGVEL